MTSYSVTHRELPYSWKWGCCVTFLRIFPCMVKDIILRKVRLNPHEVRLKRTLENSETQKNSNFLSGWRGPLVMIFGGVGSGAGGLVGGGVSGARRDR